MGRLIDRERLEVTEKGTADIRNGAQPQNTQGNFNTSF